MERMLCLFLFSPLMLLAVEREQLDKRLTAAATTQGNAYIEARDAIVNLGTDAIPTLVEAATDPRLSWRERLVARICCERVAKDSEIAALRSRDWRGEPGYNRKWEGSITGPGWKMYGLVAPVFAKARLWYYYVESTWKLTPDMALSPLYNINEDWPQWCRNALADQPEAAYLFLAMEDRLWNDPAMEQPDAVVLYKALRDAKVADAVSVLVERYEAYNKREIFGPEMYSGEDAQIFRKQFDPIFDFADTRHADLLEKFIAAHPALEPLKGRLVEVRARPASAPKPEPPFRLGTNLVSVATQSAGPRSAPPPIASSVPSVETSNLSSINATTVQPVTPTTPVQRSAVPYVILGVVTVFGGAWIIVRFLRR